MIDFPAGISETAVSSERGGVGIMAGSGAAWVQSHRADTYGCLPEKNGPAGAAWVNSRRADTI